MLQSNVEEVHGVQKTDNCRRVLSGKETRRQVRMPQNTKSLLQGDEKVLLGVQRRHDCAQVLP
jgi:hypothetical protein